MDELHEDANPDPTSFYVTAKVQICDDQDPDPETTLKLGLVTNTWDPVSETDQQTPDKGSSQIIRIRPDADLQHCSY